MTVEMPFTNHATTWNMILSVFGLALDIVGALVIALPDLVFRRYITTPETLTEARYRLFQVGYMIRGQADSEHMDAITDVIREQWEEGEVRSDPEQILIRQRWGADSADSIALVYNGDAEGFVELHAPENQQMDEEEYDWIAQEFVLYDWMGDEIHRIQRRLRWTLTGGALILLSGFILQAVAYLF